MGFADIVRCTARATGLVCLGAVLIGGLSGLSAAARAQSGSVIGSTLDPQTPNESLIPLGSFRLDAPVPMPANEGGSDPWTSPAGNEFGLQFYGNFSSPPQDSAPRLLPAPALDLSAPQP